MKRLYFCRHGLSELGKAGLWAGSTDTPMAPEGRNQARAAGLIADELEIDCIISSPLLRALETAQIIADVISYPQDKIEIDPLVVERDFGPLEATHYNSDFDVDSIEGPDGPESAESVLERARKTYEHVCSIESQSILIVSHGAFGRALRHVIYPDIPFDKHGRFENARIVQLI